MNVITWLEHEQVYFNATVQHSSHFIIETPTSDNSIPKHIYKDDPVNQQFLFYSFWLEVVPSISGISVARAVLMHGQAKQLYSPIDHEHRNLIYGCVSRDSSPLPCSGADNAIKMALSEADILTKSKIMKVGLNKHTDWKQLSPIDYKNEWKTVIILFCLTLKHHWI